MRTHSLFTVLLILISINVKTFSQVSQYMDKDENIHLLGHIDRKDLKVAPFDAWYEKVYADYELDENGLQKINEHYSKDINVKIYLGTWCGDSKREVTRFLKIMDQSKIKEENVELICLDARSESYKQGPEREEKGLNIHRVPTFIFYKNEKEVARIVESPNTSLETDIAQIYAGMPSIANYRVANYIGELFEEFSLPEVDSILTAKVKKLRRSVFSESELNTYGYVLKAANEIEKAIVVFKLNTLFYPESANCFDSLGEAYKENGDTGLAFENYMYSLQLDKTNGHAVKMIKDLMVQGGSE